MQGFNDKSRLIILSDVDMQKMNELLNAEKPEMLFQTTDGVVCATLVGWTAPSLGELTVNDGGLGTVSIVLTRRGAYVTCRDASLWTGRIRYDEKAAMHMLTNKLYRAG